VETDITIQVSRQAGIFFVFSDRNGIRLRLVCGGGSSPSKRSNFDITAMLLFALALILIVWTCLTKQGARLSLAAGQSGVVQVIWM
jgi:hypothetical protein